MDKQPYHIPVLLKESIEGLNINPEGTYVDSTYGGGGHAGEILNRLKCNGRLYAFDQDADAEQNMLPDKRMTFIRSNFRYLSNFMDWYQEEAIDGLLADLGVSSHHFDDETRGFSFRFDGDLDMRMNKRAGKTAADVLNTYTEAALADMFYSLGELRNARAIAKTITQKRNEQKIQTIARLLEILKPCFSREKEKKQWAQAFQALRIEVNGEMDALKELLMQAGDYLKPGGRLVVITYHSLEDRLVKHFFKTGNFQGETEKDFFGNKISPFKIINNKVITPGKEEIEQNPRSRSAKLRIAEKK
jgi:16S rRNA (cytosine1402-N4)-methyltransferase